MTAPGGSWAEAEVGVVLNWDNVEGELRQRLERSSAAAAQAVRKNFAKLEAETRRSFDRMAGAFEDQTKRMVRDTDVKGKAISTSWGKSMSTMMRLTEVASRRIRSSLREIPNTIAVLVDVQQVGMQPKEIRALASSLRRLQQIGNVNSAVSVTMTGADPDDIRTMATALRRLNKVGNNMHIVIDVTVNGIAQVERLSLLLRSLPRRTSTTVDVNTNSAVRAAKSIAGLGSSVLGITGTFLKFTAIAGAATVAVAGMLPAITLLGAALGSTLVAGAGAGIAAIGALALAGATIKTAFAGVGDALKNAFDPENAEKFNEALAKLTPEARTAVLSIQSLGKQFKDIVQQPVQSAFFAGLGPQIDKLSQFLVPLRDAMVTVADGFNEGAISALSFINSAQGVGMIKGLLGDSANMAANFGSALGNLVPGLIAIGAGASQVFGPMTDGIAGAARELSNMLVEAQQSGKMAEFFTNAVNVAKQLGAVLGQLGGVIGGVFRAAAAAGDGNFLGSLMTSLTSINEWVNGPGAQALTSFFQSTAAAVGTVLPILLQVAGIIGGTVAPAIAGLITAIGPAISGLVSGLGQGLAAIAPAMAPLGEAISSIATALTPVMPLFGQLIAQVVQFAGPILGALATALSPVLQALGSGLVQAFQALQPAVGPITELLAALAPIATQIAVILGQTLGAALQVLVPVFIALANAVTFVLPVVQGLVQMLQPLGPVIGAVGAAILVAVGAFKVFRIVTSIISAVRTAWMLLSLAFAVSPIGLIITGIAALAAGLALFFTKTETGRKIWDAIWNGIKATFTAVWGVIQKAWNAVYPLLAAGLQKIGDVVGWVADHWKMFAAILTGPIGIIVGLAAKFGVLQAVVRAVGAVFTWLWQNIVQPAFAAIGTIISVWWAGVQIYWNALMTIIRAVGAAIMWFWNTVVAPAFAAIGAIISAWWSGVQAVFNVFVSILSTIGSAVGSFVSTVVGFFTNLASTVWGTVSGWVSNMWSAVSGFVTNVVTTVSGFVANVIGFFTNLASTIGSTVSALWTTVVDFFRTGIDNAKTMVSNGLDAVVGFFKGIGSKITSAASGMWDGITSAFKGAINAIIDGWNAIEFKIPGFKVGPIGYDGFTLGLPDIPHLAGGGPVRGAGTATSDSIPAMLSNGEFVEPARSVSPRTLPLLEAIRGGWQPPKGLVEAMDRGIPAFAQGGLASSDLIRQAQGVVNSGYTWGGWGNGWNTDCSGAVSSLINMATGKAKGPGEGERSATGGFASWLPKMGLQPGLGQKGDLAVGWSSTHTAATLPDGQGFEHTGPAGAPGKIGGGASKADDPQFTEHAHLPMSGDPTSGQPVSGLGGTTPTGTLGGGSSTPIGSGLGSGGSSGASWGNSGGGSKFNSAAEAKRGGITPVWVENWPATMGGSATASNTLGGSTTTTGSTLGGSTTAPAASKSKVDTIPLKKNPDGTYSSTDPEWNKLIQRESGGRADVVQGIQDVNSGGNEASGLFQIAKGTWASNGGTKFAPTAGQATAEQQAEIAAKIFNDQGGSPWGSGAGQNFGREDEAKLRAGIQRKGTDIPVTSQGTVPVTVTNPSPTTTTPAPATTTTPGTTTTPSTPTTTTPGTTTKPSYESMPYGIDRANAWAGSQDFAGQARDWGIGAITGEVGAFLEPVGADGIFKKAVDELVKWAQSQQQNTPQTVKYADTVNNYGMDPNKTKDKAVEGMTAVTETYRQG